MPVTVTATRHTLPLLQGDDRIAVLARISRYSETSTALLRQLISGFGYAAAHRSAFDARSDFYADTASGRDPRAHRPDFERLQEQLVGYQVVWLWKLDRIARRKERIIKFVDLCSAAGVRVVAPGDGYDSATSTRYQLLQLAEHAEREGDAISTRYHNLKRHLADAGLYRGGGAPWGWKVAAPTEELPFPHLVLDHEPAYTLPLLDGGEPVTMSRAAMLAYIIGQVIAGTSPHRIVTWLNENHVPAARSDEWQYGALWRMLFHPTGSKHLLGYNVRTNALGEREVAHATITDEAGNTVADPLVTGEPLIDEATYQLLQDTRTEPGEPKPRAPYTRSALRGLLTCLAPARGEGLCHGTVNGPGTITSQNAVYRCNHSGRHEPDTNGRQLGNTISAARLEEYVKAQLRTRTGLDVDAMDTRELRLHLQRHITNITLHPAGPNRRTRTVGTTFDATRVVIFWTGVTPEECNAQAAAAGLTWNQAQRANAERGCPECGKPYKFLGALANHRMRLHGVANPRIPVQAPAGREPVSVAPDGTLRCDICGRPYKYAGSLETHRQRHQAHAEHVPVLALECRPCGREFSTQAARDLHNARKHPDLATATQCAECARPFKDPVALAAHLRTHTRARRWLPADPTATATSG